MRKTMLRILALIMGGIIVSTPIIASVPVFAESCTITSVLGDTKCSLSGDTAYRDDNGTLNCTCDDGRGSGVNYILNTTLTIFSISVGILAVIGISITGVQYLTAGGNEEKAKKAKRRMTEVVIGIVLYVLLYALVNWLLPA